MPHGNTLGPFRYARRGGRGKERRGGSGEVVVSEVSTAGQATAEVVVRNRVPRATAVSVASCRHWRCAHLSIPLLAVHGAGRCKRVLRRRRADMSKRSRAGERTRQSIAAEIRKAWAIAACLAANYAPPAAARAVRHHFLFMPLTRLVHDLCLCCTWQVERGEHAHAHAVGFVARFQEPIACCGSPRPGRCSTSPPLRSIPCPPA